MRPVPADVATCRRNESRRRLRAGDTGRSTPQSTPATGAGSAPSGQSEHGLDDRYSRREYDSAAASSWISGAKSTDTGTSNAGAGLPAGADVNPAVPSSFGHSTGTVPDR